MNRRDRRAKERGRGAPTGGPATTDAEGLFRAGFERQRAGRPDEALALYQKVLALRPDEPEVLHLAGVAAYELTRFAEAAELIRRAVAGAPERPEFRNNLGNALAKLGRTAEAEAAFREALRLAPGYGEAHYNLGNLLKDTGRPGEAAEAYERALTTRPNDAQVHNNRGIALRALGRQADAAAAFRRVLELSPQHAGALLTLCDILTAAGRAEEGIAFCERRLAANGGDRAAQLGLGLIHLKLQDPGRAIPLFRRVLEREPGNAWAREKLGYALMAAGDADGAIAALRAAPGHGNAVLDVALGDALIRRHAYDEAISRYRSALSAEPAHAHAETGLLKALEAVCAWDDAGPLRPRVKQAGLDAAARGQRPFETPFDALSRDADPAYGPRIAAAWSRDIAGRLSPFAVGLAGVERPANDGRITVGYLSSDFRDHPVGHLIHGLFTHHDRSRFRVIGYSTGADDGSRYRRQAAAGCDLFVDLAGVGAVAAARRIRRDGVDILVELNGHTTGSGLEICALRPAPVQAAYLGFPGTTASDFIDYILADEVVVPPGHEIHFSENVVRLPGCYMVTSPQPAAAERPTRRDCGLPENAFVFASFCQTYKIEPVMFRAWMEILDQVPRSILWLAGGDTAAKTNLRRAAAARGVAPDRLVFADRLAAKETHLARLGLADLGLDTRVFGGHTTTSDMLRAGVPVVSLMGSHFASRVGASLLRAAGLGDLVVHDLDAYRDLAAGLAGDPAALAAVRARLAAGRETSPLFDTARFARNLESAYTEMWARHTGGRPPESFPVGEA